METVVINGTPRTELGKKATRALRKAGNVPCNLYGGKETINFQAPATAFRKLIYTPDFRLAEIQLDGKSYKAILKDSQFDPIKDGILHLDFQELMDNVKVKVAIPLRLQGTPKGIIDGGKLEQAFRKLNIMALPKDLPNVIEVDITDMKLGDIKRIQDISIPGVAILHSGKNPFASVLIPRAVKEEVPTAAAATPAAGAAPSADAKAEAKTDSKADDKKK
ncbi:MAG: 50S ribosomal protein L25 [Bacteroidetes bacterium]|nr:50S ribosomal protein L25 [Bacteroidota bacterium]